MTFYIQLINVDLVIFRLQEKPVVANLYLSIFSVQLTKTSDHDMGMTHKRKLSTSLSNIYSTPQTYILYNTSSYWFSSHYYNYWTYTRVYIRRRKNIDTFSRHFMNNNLVDGIYCTRTWHALNKWLLNYNNLVKYIYDAFIIPK